MVMLIQQITLGGFGQDMAVLSDSAVTNEFTVSSLNIRPVPLMKNNMLVRLNFDFPQYFRTINYATGDMEKLSDKVVLNEMYINPCFDYGFSDKLTLFTALPIWDIHHSSAMGIVKGIGISDMEIGADYGLINKKSGENTLTAEGAIFLPTGKNKNLTSTDYPLGMGVVRLKAGLTGMHRSNNSAIIYSGYYEYRPKNSFDLNIGDEIGVTFVKQNYYNTKFGKFGIEYGALSYLKMKDKTGGTKVAYSDDFAIDAFAGAWYEYQKNLFLRFGLPCTIYQNNSIFTKYNVLIQIDYRFKL